MNRTLVFLTKYLLIFTLLSFYPYKTFGEESEDSVGVVEQLKTLQKDIKTLEKAVYSDPSSTTTKSEDFSNTNNDVLTQHLLKLSELEEQFKILTNSFEEINFKLDKLSNRITKVQTDNQLRFQDLETNGSANINKSIFGFIGDIISSEFPITIS